MRSQKQLPATATREPSAVFSARTHATSARPQPRHNGRAEASIGITLRCRLSPRLIAMSRRLYRHDAASGSDSRGARAQALTSIPVAAGVVGESASFGFTAEGLLPICGDGLFVWSV